MKKTPVSAWIILGTSLVATMLQTTCYFVPTPFYYAAPVYNPYYWWPWY